MGSPVNADDFQAVTTATNACEGFKMLLRQPGLISQFLGWILDGDGNLSEEAAASFSDYLTPVGSIILWGGTTVPSTNWLVCNGQAVSRTTYATLFQRYGTTWGTGDGSTTFNLPNVQDTIPIGAGSYAGLGSSAGGRYKTLTIANLPAHTHDMTFKRSTADTGPDDLFATGNDPGDYDDQTKTTTSVGGGEAFDALNPVKGFYFIIKAT